MPPSPLSISRTFSFSQTDTMSSLNTNSPFPLPPGPGNHPSPFCLYEFGSSRYLMYVESYGICPFVSGLFHFISILSSRLIHAMQVTGTTRVSLRCHVSVLPLVHSVPACSGRLLSPGPVQKGQPALPASSPSFFQCIFHTASKVILHFSF